jgi:tetratricopeptide (TPR) repeat protein
MKNIKLIFLSFCYLLITTATNAQFVTTPPSGGNQRSVITQYIGALVTVTVDYNSPDVHGSNGEDRTGKIWGQLVPYGMNNLGFGTAKESPWRAGSNENTVITFSHDVQIEDKDLKAGTYGLHMIARENANWTVIFSGNSSAWGSYFYDPKDDVLRVEAKAEEGPFYEWLTYDFIDRKPEEATLALLWEKMKVSFKISVPNANELYIENFRKELVGSKGFTWQAFDQAANFCLTNNTNLEEALVWSDAAISHPYFGQANFTTYSTKSQILEKLGKSTEAKELMDKAIKHPTASASQVHAYGRQLITAGKKQEALGIFKYNLKQNKSAWPTNYGLSRGYSALGDFKNAIKYLKLAIANVPEGNTAEAQNLKTNLSKLEKKEDIN